VDGNRREANRPVTTELSERRRGFVYVTSAYLLWGLFPLYFPLLEPASPLEILAHRVVWCLVVCVVLLRFTSGFGGVRNVLRNGRQTRLLVLAAVLVSVNWGVYIWAVNTQHVVEASLGYFINPIVSILFGVLVLGERLRTMQWLAVGIAFVAIVVITIDVGHLPWIALVLAFSFGGYGLCKKKADVNAADSLAIETGVLFLPALVTLIVIAARGNLAFGTVSVGNSLLLAGAGLVTAVPLLLFTAGTTRLPLSIVGMVQFITPIMQFIVGVWIRHENLPVAVLIGFCLVWAALTVLTIDALRHRAQATEPRPTAATPERDDDVAELI
jgi:chloramphenicol-sensitive protein RarD